MTFDCNTCGTSFQRKQQLIRHLNKKYKCKYYSPIITEDGLFECRNCGGKYDKRRALSDHLSICIRLKERKLEEPINGPKTVINIDGDNNTVNNQTINQTININIDAPAMERILKPFEKSNVDVLTHKQILDAIRKGGGPDSIIKLMTEVHFNENNPQFHNVLIKSDENALTYDGDDWRSRNTHSVVNQMTSWFVDVLGYFLNKIRPSFPNHYSTKKAVDDYNNNQGEYITDKVKKAAKRKSHIPELAMDETEKAEREKFRKLYESIRNGTYKPNPPPSPEEQFKLPE